MLNINPIRRRGLRMFLVGILAAGAVAIPVIATAMPAEATSASDPCGGTLVAQDPIKTETGAVIGYLNIHHNRTNGQWCAVTLHTGSIYGVPRWTGIGSYPAAVTPNTDANSLYGDQGNYSLYAGPLYSPTNTPYFHAEGWINASTNEYNTREYWAEWQN